MQVDKHMNIRILPFSQQYLDSFRLALGDVAREKKFLAFLDAPPRESVADFVRMLQEQKMPHLIAINDNNEVVGWCDISPLDRPVFEHVGSLGIAITKAYRGQGIGEQLLTQALDLAKARGLTRIELTVREHNIPAIRLYEKKGFVIEGIHRNAVRIDGVYENHVFMALID